MKRIELRLIPAPGQKPEFLATLELVQKTPIPALWEQFPSSIVLEGYTRDAWVMDTSTPHWMKWQVESVDGRNKLPGFIKYLVDRQKTAYGRVPMNAADHPPYVLVIPPKQMSSTAINCRIAPMQQIPNCPLKPISTTTTKSLSSSSALPSAETAAFSASLANTKSTTSKHGNTAATTTTTSAKPKKSGLLGNLVGAQRRTNQQVQIATAVAPKKVAPPASSSGTQDPSNTGSMMNTDPAMIHHHQQQQESNHHLVGTKTAGQVLAEFRQEMEQEMLDFDISPEPCLKIKIDLPTKLRLLTDDEKQTGRVTMEVLKYIVYEQAEEVNEEWIAHKEPSEFMDEAVIAIYKEGEAPPEVLEEINKGELPDEIRGQQRAIVEQRQKAELIKAQKLQMEQTRLALQNKAKTSKQQAGGGANHNDNGDEGYGHDYDDDEDDDLAALNTKKRDRRTVEDFEREAKRRRGEL